MSSAVAPVIADGSSGAGLEESGSIPTLLIPEIRDYQRINAELVGLLDAGHTRVRLARAEGQRLLVSGLRGSWKAEVEVEGLIGPELAAGLEAPGLTVVSRGDALDGAGSGLVAGLVMVLGRAGSALGYAQRGGLLAVRGDAGPRAGLNQSGGVLIVGGGLGRLAGERQSGGHFFALKANLGPHAGHARRGGRFVALSSWDERSTAIDAADSNVLSNAISRLSTWFPGS
jgi:glutamate synthase domain-containing protein 3